MAQIPTDPTPAVGADPNVHDLGWGVMELNPLTEEKRDALLVQWVELLLEVDMARQVRLERTQ